MSQNIDILKSLWEATILVKLIITILIFASLLSWSIILKKRSEFFNYMDLNQQFLEQYRSTGHLNEFFKKSQDFRYSPLLTIFQFGYDEFSKISEKFSGNQSREFLQEHFSKFGFGIIERSMEKAKEENFEKLQDQLSTLASIGSISPFIGLLGTVWGIIHAFSGLSGQNASLEAVAPGIAEALVTTAIGLFAAIPAVVAYNFFNNQIDKIQSSSSRFGYDFINLIERSLVPNLNNQSQLNQSLSKNHTKNN